MSYWSILHLSMVGAHCFCCLGPNVVEAKSHVHLPEEVLSRDDVCSLGSSQRAECSGLLQVDASRKLSSEGVATVGAATTTPVDCEECYHLPQAADGSYTGLHCPCLVAHQVPEPKLSLDLPESPANGDAPALYIELMKSTVLNTVYRPKATAKDGSEQFPECNGSLTMIGRRRLDNTHELLLRVLAFGVPGDFIETGSWKGGSTALAAAVLQAHGQLDADRRWVWMADSFKGIPPVKPDLYPIDATHVGAEHLNEDCVISPASVRRSFQLLGLPSEAPAVQILEGYFNETLQAEKQKAIFASRRFSLLRLDGDTYESTYQALQALYPYLSVGGFVIVDDYMDWKGARQATLDYRAEHGISSPIVAVYHEHVRVSADNEGEIPRGVWWRKL